MKSNAPTLDLRLGLSGFTMGVEEYFRHFNVVEVQQTFYDPPRLETLRRWRDLAPRDFEFTMKAWQVVTHLGTSRTYRRLRRAFSERERAEAGAFRATPTVARAWKTTLACAKVLRASCILLQCPASFTPTDGNIENLRAFAKTSERLPNTRLMWEPRGDWPQEVIESLCRELDLVHAVDPFNRPTATPRLPYYRLHGISGSRHVYSDEELRRLRQLLPASGLAYLFFNNIPRIGDAKRFAELFSGKTASKRVQDFFKGS